MTILRTEYRTRIPVSRLAKASAMSLTAFHVEFKKLTTLTPGQFQKRLRLIEARRLMVHEGLSATRAAFDVGYESVSQFTREYARMFGALPKRDSLRALRESPGRAPVSAAVWPRARDLSDVAAGPIVRGAARCHALRGRVGAADAHQCGQGRDIVHDRVLGPERLLPCIQALARHHAAPHIGASTRATRISGTNQRRHSKHRALLLHALTIAGPIAPVLPAHARGPRVGHFWRADPDPFSQASKLRPPSTTFACFCSYVASNIRAIML
jgi:AraC-like DNA-binding protein